MSRRSVRCHETEQAVTYKFVPVGPSSKVLAVTLVAIDGDISLSRVGRDEDECNILVSSGRGGSSKVVVVEEPADGRSVLTSLGLDSFQGL